MRKIKKITAVLAMAAVLITLFSGTGAWAKSKEKAPIPKAPKISLKLVDNGKDQPYIKVTIKKTATAQKGIYASEYLVSWTCEPDGSLCKGLYDMYGDQSQIGRCDVRRGWGPYAGVYSCADVNYSRLIDAENGNTEFRIKGAQPGTYKVKVRADSFSSDNRLRYKGDYCKVKTIKIKYDVPKTKGYLDTYDFTKAEVGDTLKFGAYEQDKIYSNGKETLEWIVMSRDDETLTLASKYAIDELTYNLENIRKSFNVKDCTVYKWMNGPFADVAFNKTERSMITDITLCTEDAPACTYAWRKGMTSKEADSVTADGEPECNWMYMHDNGFLPTNMYIDHSLGVRPCITIKAASDPDVIEEAIRQDKEAHIQEKYGYLGCGWIEADEEEGIREQIYIDGYKTEDDYLSAADDYYSEIAIIYLDTLEVKYNDEDAKRIDFAQSLINYILKKCEDGIPRDGNEVPIFKWYYMKFGDKEPRVAK